MADVVRRPEEGAEEQDKEALFPRGAGGGITRSRPRGRTGEPPRFVRGQGKHGRAAACCASRW